MDKIKDVFGYLLKLSLKKPIVPVICIKGPITSQTTKYISLTINNIPKRISGIAVLIDSAYGQLVQTDIITKKLKQLSNQRNVKLITFGQDKCINAGFMMLMAGDRIYVDRTTILGITQLGQSKITSRQLFEKIGVDQIIYSSSKSETTFNQLSHFNELSEDKREQLLQIDREHIGQLEQTIKRRGRKNENMENILELTIGNQALEKGLVDQIGTYTKILDELYPKCQAKLIMSSAIRRRIQKFKEMKIYWQLNVLFNN